MTPEQIDLVERTLAQARPGLDDMAIDFYARLFRAEPQLATLFTSDPAAQRDKFVAELEAIVATIHRHPIFLEAAQDLGVRHRGYGVQAPHYGMVGAALLAALAEALGDTWTDEVQEAWRLAYNLAAEAMMDAATRSPN